MTRPPADRSHLDAALGYAARGILVLPLHYPVTWSDQDGAPGVGCSCGDPACGPVGKHPMTGHGLHDATTSRARVEWWWRRFPQANIGLATGHQFDVLDIDGPDGEQAIAQLSAGKRFGAPGPVVRTGRGGWHVYLAPTGLGNPHPRGLEQVDWRGRGGYVVAPPSRHASGTRYRWVRDLDTPIPQVPAALRERLEPPTVAPRPAVPTTIQPVTPGHPYGQRVLELRLAELAHAPKGQRNHTLYRAGLRLFSLAAGGVLDRDQVEAGLLAAAEHSGLLADEPPRLATRSARRPSSAAGTPPVSPPVSPPGTGPPAPAPAGGHRGPGRRTNAHTAGKNGNAMADPAIVAARHTHKRCPDCDQILPASAFYRRPNGYLSAYCKPHQRQRGRAWHAQHRPPGQPRRASAHGADRNRLPAAPLLAAVRRYAQRRHLTLKELLGPQLDGAFDHAQAAGTISLINLERFCDEVLGWHPRMLYGDAYDHAAFHLDSEASSQPRPTQRPARSRTGAP